MKTKVMEVITYKNKLIKKCIIEAALEYRPPLNKGRNSFSEKKIKAAASILENTAYLKNFNTSFRNNIIFFTNIPMPRQTMPVFYANKVKFKPQAAGKKSEKRFLIG